jgi:hypothetical protein
MRLNVQTHEQLVKKLLRRRGVRTEVERIEREEATLLDAILSPVQLSHCPDFCYYSAMSSEATKLLEAALKLPPEARAAMAGSLLESLDVVVDADAEAEWDRAIARRLKDLDTAPARVVAWSDARRTILGR